MATSNLQQAIEQSVLFQREATPSSNLIVFCHGADLRLFPRNSAATRAKGFAKILKFLMTLPQRPFSNSDLLPLHFINTLYNPKTADEIALELAEQIHAGFECRNYKAVYLFGYSTGSLLLRRALMHAFECEDKNWIWHRYVDRFVFVANANRGFKVVNDQSFARQLLWIIDQLGLQSFLNYCGIGRLGFATYRDSPWMKNLRIQWLRMFEAGGPLLEPKTVQLYGTQDELVGDDDRQECYRFANGISIALCGLRHDCIRDTSGATGVEPAILDNEDTCKTLIDAFTVPIDKVIRPAEAHRAAIVFMVHGIRDFADWQENLAYHLRDVFRADTAPGNLAKEIEVVHVRYGYFNAFQFLFSSQRERSVRAFVDAYYQTLTRFPYVDRENIHLVAHSNGTLVVAEALRHYEQIRLNRVLLAGSVLRANFLWDKIFERGQFQTIHNLCANEDWPVGRLCQTIGRLPWNRIGTGGYHGFSRTRALGQTEPFLHNSYMQGGHGIGLRTASHVRIAEYLLGKSSLEVNPGPIPNPAFQLISYLWLSAVGVAIILLICITFIAPLIMVSAACGFGIALVLIYILSRI